MKEIRFQIIWKYIRIWGSIWNVQFRFWVDKTFISWPIILWGNYFSVFKQQNQIKFLSFVFIKRALVTEVLNSILKEFSFRMWNVEYGIQRACVSCMRVCGLNEIQFEKSSTYTILYDEQQFRVFYFCGFWIYLFVICFAWNLLIFSRKLVSVFWQL